jgi:hypothetical protein
MQRRREEQTRMIRYIQDKQGGVGVVAQRDAFSLQQTGLLLPIVVKLERVHGVGADLAAAIATALLLRLLVTEALAARDEQISAGASAPTVTAKCPLVRVVSEARVDL